MAKRIGETLLNETIQRQARARPKLREPRFRLQIDNHLRRQAPPLLDQRLQRRGKPELVERGGAQVGEDAAVLLLQRAHGVADGAGERGRALVGAADPRLQRHRVGAEREQVRANLVVQFARDHPPLLVVGVDHPLQQAAHVGQRSPSA